jgi:hypothetical protein
LMLATLSSHHPIIASSFHTVIIVIGCHLVKKRGFKMRLMTRRALSSRNEGSNAFDDVASTVHQSLVGGSRIHTQVLARAAYHLADDAPLAKPTRDCPPSDIWDAARAHRAEPAAGRRERRRAERNVAACARREHHRRRPTHPRPQLGSAGTSVALRPFVIYINHLFPQTCPFSSYSLGCFGRFWAHGTVSSNHLLKK